MGEVGTCVCGRFSVGRCVACRARLCERHIAERDDRVLCSDCAESADEQAASQRKRQEHIDNSVVEARAALSILASDGLDAPLHIGFGSYASFSVHNATLTTTLRVDVDVRLCDPDDVHARTDEDRWPEPPFDLQDWLATPEWYCEACLLATSHDDVIVSAADVWLSCDPLAMAAAVAESLVPSGASMGALTSAQHVDGQGVHWWNSGETGCARKVPEPEMSYASLRSCPDCAEASARIERSEAQWVDEAVAEIAKADTDVSGNDPGGGGGWNHLGDAEEDGHPHTD